MKFEEVQQRVPETIRLRERCKENERCNLGDIWSIANDLTGYATNKFSVPVHDGW
jgi:hypothetical protein